MSLLNQLFNRGVFGAKCKTCLTLAISRIKLLQNKRDVQLKHMRKEIAQFLQAGQEPIARIRVEHVIREQNVWAAYEILELFCEFVLARVPILESQKDCPAELREAISSIIFASPRCSEVPDLLQIKNLFTTKYGKEFVMAASELRPDSGVNRTIVEKLSISAPSAEARLTVLKEIAKEYSLEWDSSNTEAELSKKHEDLLGGPKQIVHEATSTQAPNKQNTPTSNTLNETHAVINTGRKPGSLLPPDRSTTNDKRETVSESSDVLERARAAMAYAERATAAARAAALLVNREFGSTKPEEGAK